MSNTNTKFLLDADKQIDQQLEVISEALHNYVEEKRNGEHFDPLVSVAANVIVGSKIIHSMLGELGEDMQQSRQNIESLSLYLSDKLEEYQGEATILDMIQALLAISSSMSLSFAEEYYNAEEDETNITTEQA